MVLIVNLCNLTQTVTVLQQQLGCSSSDNRSWFVSWNLLKDLDAKDWQGWMGSCNTTTCLINHQAAVQSDFDFLAILPTAACSCWAESPGPQSEVSTIWIGRQLGTSFVVSTKLQRALGQDKSRLQLPSRTKATNNKFVTSKKVHKMSTKHCGHGTPCQVQLEMLQLKGTGDNPGQQRIPRRCTKCTAGDRCGQKNLCPQADAPWQGTAFTAHAVYIPVTSGWSQIGDRLCRETKDNSLRQSAIICPGSASLNLFDTSNQPVLRNGDHVTSPARDRRRSTDPTPPE